MPTTTPSATTAPVQSKLATNRADFIRRLFAVVVSVGFANELIRMQWITESRWPSPAEIPHILFLFVGLFLIIQSWDGYLSALEHRPLETKPRFYLDTITIFSYLVLLTASNISHGIAAFLFFVCWIFTLYMIWDFLTFREFHQDYGAANNHFSTYRNEIVSAIQSRPSTLRHGLSTIVAFLWFLEIYGVYLQRKNGPSYLYLLAVLAGLIMYRWDKSEPFRLSVILLPILIGAAFFVYVAVFQ